MAKAAATCTVELDARVELIEGLAAASGARPADGGEAVELARRCLPGTHEAARLFRGLTRSDWRHRTPAMILLDFTAPPELAVGASKDHYANAGKDDALAAFLPVLREYARLPEVGRYLARLPKLHARSLAMARGLVSAAGYLPPLERYLGVALPHRYHFVVSPLIRGVNGQNVLYRRSDGVCDIYSLSSLEEALRAGVAEFQDTAWHEVCHTVVDDWTRARAAAFEPFEPLYALMRGRAKSEYQGPPGWLHMIDEHVIRAVCARLAAQARGEEAGRKAMEAERQDGFVLIGSFYEALRRYESERGRYPALSDFYPAFAELLSKLSAGVRRPVSGA